VPQLLHLCVVFHVLIRQCRLYLHRQHRVPVFQQNINLRDIFPIGYVVAYMGPAFPKPYPRTLNFSRIGGMTRCSTRSPRRPPGLPIRRLFSFRSSCL
jgi:hypothetical protein